MRVIYDVSVHLESVPRIVAFASACAIACALPCKCQYSRQLKQSFKIMPYFFLSLQVFEEPTKHANKIIILIFLIMKATVLKKHGGRNDIKHTFLYC